MSRKAACIGLGIWRSKLEPCPFQIQTSLGGASDRFHFMTRERLSVQMKLNHATDSFRLGMIDVVTTTESYDVLVGGVVLYSMGFYVTTPLWAECEGEAHTPKSGNLESSGTPKNSEDDLRGQISSHQCAPGVIGKVLKSRCPK
jgi:hypothetical protein